MRFPNVNLSSHPGAWRSAEWPIVLSSISPRTTLHRNLLITLSLLQHRGEANFHQALAPSLAQLPQALLQAKSGFLSAHLACMPIAQCLASGHQAAARTCQIFDGFAQA